MFTTSQRQLLRAISEAGPLSRTELAALMGFSKAAMSGIVRQLIGSGIVHETQTVYGHGRPSVLLDLAPDFAFFAGVALLDDPTAMVLSDLNGNLVARCALPLARDPEAMAAAIARGLPELLALQPDAGPKLFGIGVALSGLVDNAQRRCLRSTLLDWIDVPLAEMIMGLTGIDTFVENDARAVAVSEKLFGGARELRNFSVVTLGEGVGCAHFNDGKLYRGGRGGAGEIAHCTIDLGGAPCRCGKRGCLDTIASLQAIREMARAEGLDWVSLPVLEQQAAGGTPAALRIVHRSGSALGLALAHLIQINDPEVIFIVHVEGAVDGLFGTIVRQSMEANVLPSRAGQTPLRMQQVDREIWARGAASVAAKRFLLGPLES